MTNTIIDNSENFKLVDTIKEIIKEPRITQIDIATGYWDIPGTAILADELDKFLERDGTKLRILIGKDPYLFSQYNKNPKYKDFHNGELKNAIAFIRENEAKFKVRLTTENQEKNN